MNVPALLAIYLAAVNVIALVAFGYDKKLAIDGLRRIPENTLLLLAMAGGSVGAMAGRRLFNHKTRKQPFGSMLDGIAVLQALLLMVVVFKPFLIDAFPT